MTDNVAKSTSNNPVIEPIIDSDLDSNNLEWQLTALTAALGDLTLTIKDSLSVGRGSDNDMVLGSKEVSRNHALLSVLNDELYVKDLDSSNGTFVNDKRIESNQSTLITADDTLAFASFSFRAVALEADDNIFNTDTDTDTDSTASTPDTSSPVEPVVERSDNKTILTSDQTPEPIVKETIIGEVLAASAGATLNSVAPLEEDIVAPLPSTTEQETMMSTNESIEKITGESVAKNRDTTEHTAHETGASNPTTDSHLTHEKGGHQETVVTPEHDKTTTTALQEEADPDVLRAKQAATAQFSGTANLGTGRDVGTSGNNAMDQAIDNPANAGVTEKEPSGSWFIWVFIAIIIIGIVLWLFNSGSV